MRASTSWALVSFAAAMLVATTAFAQPAPFASKPFSDVPTTHPNYDAIEYLRKYNVLRGYLDGTFRPSTRINRAEIIRLITNPYILSGERVNDCINRTFGPNLPDTIYFPDVKRDAWYAEDVCIATLKHLVNGYPDGTFKPARNIIFVEAAKIILNTFSDRKSTRLNSSHIQKSRMPSSA